MPSAGFYDIALGHPDVETPGRKKRPLLLGDAEPLRDALKYITETADAAVASNSSGHGRCAVLWLQEWAKSEALLGTMAGPQSEAERRWTLAGAAIAYLKVKRFATPGEKLAIEGWLEQVTEAALKAFDDPSLPRNTHWYWMGLGVTATAAAADIRRYWALGRDIMKTAAAEIADDGTISTELARGPRALYYHGFALMPLMTMAALAHTRGEDWMEFNDGVLGRLTMFTVNGLADPGLVTALTGVPQEQPVKTTAGWISLYGALHPEWTPPAGVVAQTSHRWLGGDVRNLLPAQEEPAADVSAAQP